MGHVYPFFIAICEFEAEIQTTRASHFRILNLHPPPELRRFGPGGQMKTLFQAALRQTLLRWRLPWHVNGFSPQVYHGIHGF